MGINYLPKAYKAAGGDTNSQPTSSSSSYYGKQSSSSNNYKSSSNDYYNWVTGYKKALKRGSVDYSQISKAVSYSAKHASYNSSYNSYDKSYSNSNIGSEYGTPINAKKNRTMLDRIFDTLSIGQYGVMGLLSNVFDEKGNFSIGDGLSGLWEGVKAGNPFGQGNTKGEYQFADVLNKYADWDENYNYMKERGVYSFYNPVIKQTVITKDKKGEKFADAFKFADEIGGDIFLDPLTYCSFGLSDVFKGSGKVMGKTTTRLTGEAVKSMAKKAGIELAEDVATKYAKRLNVLRGLNESETGIKIFGKQVTDGALTRKIGDATIAPIFNTIRNNVRTSKFARTFSNNAKLAKVAADNPEEALRMMNFVDKVNTMKFNKLISDKEANEYVKKIFGDMDDETQRTIFDLVESNAKYDDVPLYQFRDVSQLDDEVRNYLSSSKATNRTLREEIDSVQRLQDNGKLLDAIVNDNNPEMQKVFKDILDPTDKYKTYEEMLEKMGIHDLYAGSLSRQDSFSKLVNITNNDITFGHRGRLISQVGEENANKLFELGDLYKKGEIDEATFRKAFDDLYTKRLENQSMYENLFTQAEEKDFARYGVNPDHYNYQTMTHDQVKRTRDNFTGVSDLNEPVEEVADTSLSDHVYNDILTQNQEKKVKDLEKRIKHNQAQKRYRDKKKFEREQANLQKKLEEEKTKLAQMKADAQSRIQEATKGITSGPDVPYSTKLVSDDLQPTRVRLQPSDEVVKAKEQMTFDEFYEKFIKSDTVDSTIDDQFEKAKSLMGYVPKIDETNLMQHSLSLRQAKNMKAIKQLPIEDQVAKLNEILFGGENVIAVPKNIGSNSLKRQTANGVYDIANNVTREQALQADKIYNSAVKRINEVYKAIANGASPAELEDLVWRVSYRGREVQEELARVYGYYNDLTSQVAKKQQRINELIRRQRKYAMSVKAGKPDKRLFNKKMQEEFDRLYGEVAEANTKITQRNFEYGFSKTLSQDQYRIFLENRGNLPLADMDAQTVRNELEKLSKNMDAYNAQKTLDGTNEIIDAEAHGNVDAYKAKTYDSDAEKASKFLNEDQTKLENGEVNHKAPTNDDGYAHLSDEQIAKEKALKEQRKEIENLERGFNDYDVVNGEGTASDELGEQFATIKSQAADEAFNARYAEVFHNVRGGVIKQINDYTEKNFKILNKEFMSKKVTVEELQGLQSTFDALRNWTHDKLPGSSMSFKETILRILKIPKGQDIVIYVNSDVAKNILTPFKGNSTMKLTHMMPFIDGLPEKATYVSLVAPQLHKRVLIKDAFTGQLLASNINDAGKIQYTYDVSKRALANLERTAQEEVQKKVVRNTIERINKGEVKEVSQEFGNVAKEQETLNNWIDDIVNDGEHEAFEGVDDVYKGVSDATPIENNMQFDLSGVHDADPNAVSDVSDIVEVAGHKYIALDDGHYIDPNTGSIYTRDQISPSKYVSDRLEAAKQSQETLAKTGTSANTPKHLSYNEVLEESVVVNGNHYLPLENNYYVNVETGKVSKGLPKTEQNVSRNVSQNVSRETNEATNKVSNEVTQNVQKSTQKGVQKEAINPYKQLGDDVNSGKEELHQHVHGEKVPEKNVTQPVKENVSYRIDKETGEVIETTPAENAKALRNARTTGNKELDEALEKGQQRSIDDQFEVMNHAEASGDVPDRFTADDFIERSDSSYCNRNTGEIVDADTYRNAVKYDPYTGTVDGENLPELLNSKSLTDVPDHFSSQQELVDFIAKRQKDLDDVLAYNNSMIEQVFKANRAQMSVEDALEAARAMGDDLATQYADGTTKLERMQKLFSGDDDALTFTVRDIANEIKIRLRQMGAEEKQAGRVENLIDNYMPHIINPELMKDPRFLAKLKCTQPQLVNEVLKGSNGVFNPFSISRSDAIKQTYGYTVKEVNEAIAPILKHYGLDTEFFIHEAGDAYLMRALKHNQIMYTSRFSDEICEEFGKAINPANIDLDTMYYVKSANIKQVMRKLSNQQQADVLKLAGFNLERNYDKTLIKMSGQDFITMSNAISKYCDGVAPIAYDIPEYLASKADNLGFAQAFRDKSAFLKVYDNFSNLWKNMVTVATPGFHLRNAFTNVFQNYLNVGADVFNPSIRKGVSRVIRGDGGELVTKAGQHISYDDLRMAAQAYGVVDDDFFTKSTSFAQRGMVKNELASEGKGLFTYFNGGVTSKYAKLDPTDINNFIPYDLGHKVASKIEGYDRMLNFTINVRNGLGFDEAAEMTNKFLFDYSDLTTFEKDFMRRIIPFYTWIRKNAPLQMEQLMTNPGAYRLVGKTTNYLNRDTDMDVMPGFMRDWVRLPIERNDEELFLNPNMSYGQINDVAELADVTNPSSQYRKLINMSNPLIKVPIELARNNNSYFDEPIYGDEGSGVGNYLLSMSGFVKNAADLGDAAINGGDVNDALNAFSLGTGIKTRFEDYEQRLRSAQYDALKEVQEKAKKEEWLEEQKNKSEKDKKSEQ